MSEKMSFDKAMERLSEIVRELEGDNLSLEESIELFEEGLILSSTSQKQLKEFETKIESLVDKYKEEADNETTSG